MVVTADGFFYQYSLDPVRGGECKLVNERTLLETETEHISAQHMM